jgi:NitT/TauT family transport system substrate-binding protein
VTISLKSRNLSRRSFRTAAVVLLATASLVAVSACSSASAPATGSSKAPAASAPVKSLGTVKLGKAVDSVGYMPIDIAEAEGYFKDEGVTVQSSVLAGSAVVYSALQSGSIQFGTASAPAMLPAAAKGVPLYSVLSLDYGNPLQLLVSKAWATAHHMTAKNQKATTVMKSLKGAKLASISISNSQAYGYLEQAAGTSPSDYQVITVDSVNAVLAGLQHGQFDAFAVPPPTSIQAQAQGIGVIMPSLKSIPEAANSMFDILTTTQAYAKANPKVVRAVATAIARAENDMINNPDKVMPIIQKHFPTLSKQVLTDSVNYLTFAKDGKQTAARWTAANVLLGKTGGQPTTLDLSSTGPVWTNKFIDAAGLK